MPARCACSTALRLSRCAASPAPARHKDGSTKTSASRVMPAARTQNMLTSLRPCRWIPPVRRPPASGGRTMTTTATAPASNTSAGPNQITAVRAVTGGL
jgi:hypothetical protein